MASDNKRQAKIDLCNAPAIEKLLLFRYFRKQSPAFEQNPNSSQRAKRDLRTIVGIDYSLNALCLSLSQFRIYDSHRSWATRPYVGRLYSLHLVLAGAGLKPIQYICLTFNDLCKSAAEWHSPCSGQSP